MSTPTSSAALFRPRWPRSGNARFDTRSSAHDGLATGLENRFERLDPVVGGLEEEIVHHRLGLLELLDECERHRAARHRAAELRVDAVARRPAENGDRSLLTRLQEVRRLDRGPLLGRSAFLLVHRADIVVVCTLETYASRSRRGRSLRRSPVRRISGYLAEGAPFTLTHTSP